MGRKKDKRNKQQPVEEAPEATTTSSTPHLTVEDLKTVLIIHETAALHKNHSHMRETGIFFHPDYQVQEWKDGAPPFTLTQVHEMSDFYFIGYVCSKENCHKCDEANPSGHHKLLDKEGRDIYGKQAVFSRGS